MSEMIKNQANSRRHDFLNSLCREFIRNNLPAIWEGLVNTANRKYPPKQRGRPRGNGIHVVTTGAYDSGVDEKASD